MEQYSTILGICFVCAFTIIVYGTIRCKSPSFRDPLTKSFFPAPWNNFFDGWGIAHFLFYGLLGYLFPSRWIFITLLGIVWELIEMTFKEHPFYLSKCAAYATTDKPGGWWYGRWEDIIMNTAGMLTGIYMSPFRK